LSSSISRYESTVTFYEQELKWKQ